MPGFTALDAWELMQRKGIRLPFVLLSGAIGETAAVAAIKAGISDYLPKDDLSKLRHVTQRAIEMNRILLAKELADIELAQSEKLSLIHICGQALYAASQQRNKSSHFDKKPYQKDHEKANHLVQDSPSRIRSWLATLA